MRPFPFPGHKGKIVRANVLCSRFTLPTREHMNDNQVTQSEEVSETEIRELSEAEVLAVAGGPQVMNDSH